MSGPRLLGVTLFVQAPNLLLDVSREANKRTGIADITPDSLRYPVKAVGAETETFFVLKFLRRTDQSKRPFLNKIEIAHTPAFVARRNGIDESKVVHDQAVSSLGVCA